MSGRHGYTIDVNRAVYVTATGRIAPGAHMERVVHKSESHEEARRWDIEQHVSMTVQERQRVARELKRRAYPRDAKDVRACHRPE